jgi:uncharacterized protein YqjF (DUF2071 family)
MAELAVEVGEIHKLLLDPSAKNVLQVTSCLESLAQEVARVRVNLRPDQHADEATLAFLLTARREALRTRALLDKAARFYSGLNVRTEATGYGRHGLLRTVEAPRRALARL